MNDTERDLRELFETKAREAGAAPRVTPEVLRRGRRRQAGTVVAAGITALAVAAAAIVSLQALSRADSDAVPGGPRENPSFTATIQNFTLTVPKGWTLIDQWPIGANMAVGSSGGSSSSCVGPPVEAGTGKNAPQPDASASDCADQQKPPPEPPTIPEGGLPMLTLSNDDPGLGRSVCNSDGTLPSGSAALYIGLDYAATNNAGWQNDVPAWPMQEVSETDPRPEQTPCGPGRYSRFQTGGAPYIAWIGFGSEVTDADRRALLDVFDGMQVSDAEITSPTTDVPGYVLTGGTTDSGAGWNIEAYPNGTNVDMAYTEEGGRWGGAGDFGPPVVPIQLASGHGVVFGSVTFEADRVELRPSDGSDPIQGSILRFPESLGAPFDAFVISSSEPGEVVAVGPDGDLGSESIDVAVSSSAAPPQAVESSVALTGFWAPGNLTASRETANGCLSIVILIGGEHEMGVANCGNGRMQPDEPFAAMQPTGYGEGVTVVSGYVPPKADRVFFVSDDGRRFDAPMLYTLQVEPRVQFFSFPVSAKTGELHVEDMNGVALSAPIALSRAR